MTLTLRPGPPPSRKPGAPGRGAGPTMEQVRVTSPDLVQRATLDKARGRMLITALMFAGLYGVLVLRLAYATVIHPILPTPAVLAAMQPQLNVSPPPPGRADITDRNGTILAVSLPGAELYADPRQVTDPVGATEKLVSVLPGLDANATEARLSSGKDFVYLDRRLTPEEELAVNQLGIPGVYFEDNEKRHYPDGNLAAHILGAVNVGGVGIAGVEEYFNQRLTTNPQPLALSIDAGIESIVHDELAAAVKEFQSPGACAIVMNDKTGEILAMVSLPDYDANDYANAPPNSQFDRCVAGDYEPGSVFKLQTMSMALDSGMIHYWDYFDTTHPLRVGRFQIQDFEPVNYLDGGAEDPRRVLQYRRLADRDDIGAADRAGLVHQAGLLQALERAIAGAGGAGISSAQYLEAGDDHDGVVRRRYRGEPAASGDRRCADREWRHPL